MKPLLVSIRRWIPVVCAVGVLSLAQAQTTKRVSNRELAAQILEDPELGIVLEKARALLKTGLNAGGGYGEVWIRDLNTFIEIALETTPHAVLREALLTFFRFQGPAGDIPDGYIAREKGNTSYRYRQSPSAPQFLAHKNTVETDQESSLIQAVRRYVDATGDKGFLQEVVDGKTVLDRLDGALAYLIADRFDRRHGLIWGATTADWGDVQPEHPWGVELDTSSHRTIDIYDNALFASAISDYLHLLPRTSKRIPYWREVRADLVKNIRKHLWDTKRHKFVPHIYLEGSPFPGDFDEASITYHGGTAVAIEAGVLSHSEVAASLELMRRNMRQAGASSIGLTVYPPYPKGFFKNPSMSPYSYQNGGDWCWFGGRMIRQLTRHGFPAEAYAELKPMVSRVVRHGDFYEWWSLDNQPRGSNHYRGSAGVLGKAIEELQTWARANQGRSAPSTKPTR